MAKSYVTKVEKSIKEESDKILLARKAISKKAVDLENMEIAQEALSAENWKEKSLQRSQ